MSSTPATSSGSAPSTSASEGSSADPAIGSTTISTTSWTRALQTVDLESLSPRSRAIKVLIGDRIPSGYKLKEIASELGVSSSSVSDLLNELRSDLVLQSGRFLPLTDAEYQALRDSIQTYGQQVPILLGQHIPVVDGLHRLLVLEELEIDEVLIIELEGLTAEQEHDVAFTINVARRHLNRAQKELLIRYELSRDATRSSRRIAAICGVHHETVETVRRTVAREQEVARPQPQPRVAESATSPEPTVMTSPPEPERRVDTLGRSQPARKAPVAPMPERALGYVVCGSCGQRHSLWRDGEGFRLETV